MRYHYEKKEAPGKAGELYSCRHKLYNSCTLFRTGNKGLAVVCKRFNPTYKTAWWGPIDNDIAYAIESHPGFKNFLESKAEKADENGLYPTIGLRRIMWALRMKPLVKEAWEYDL